MCASFHPVPSPNVVGGRADSIAGTSPTDLWTVGLGVTQPTILHWDGSTWTISPQDATTGSSTSVAAISPADAWLVGETPPEGYIPLSKHWDGTMWRTVTMPQIGSNDTLSGVAAVSSSDVWAAGAYDNGAHPLVMHWDGTTWHQVPAPDGVQRSTNVLFAISAVSASDIWAVGFNDEGFVNSKPLIEHYDGTAWSVVASPPLPGNDNFLYAVSASASDDVWAVGEQGDAAIASRTLAEHWDGTAWTIVPTPNVKGIVETFYGVDAVSPTDAWAVGLRRPASNDMTLAAHWDGVAWTLVKIPPLQSASIAGIREVTPTQVWTTGSVFNPTTSNYEPLILRSKGCAQ